ncbi:MAG: nucleotidyltransferase domain-containing protein [Methanobrevibacter sp. CfCl-M3]
MNLNSIEILKYLIINNGKNLTIKDISQGINKDYKNTFNNVKNLSKENILEIEKIGNSNIVKPIKNPNPYFFSAEYSRREDILENKKIKNIFNVLKRLYFPQIVLLFGSYGKNTYNKHSDIDLLIISDEKYHEKIESKLNILPYDIHSIYLTFEEFVDSLLSKEFTVVSEAIKQNIILIGIEEYYNLLTRIK